MPETVEWLADGTPRSPRFGARYFAGLQPPSSAATDFMRTCGLPAAWRGQRQWRILETGFGLGLNFLACWRAWRDDAQRPGILHFVSLEAWPVAGADIVRSASSEPALAPLGAELAGQWFGLTGGAQRFAFEGGRVLLTVFIGDVRQALAQQVFRADSVFLDGFDPQVNPAMWDRPVLKAIARHCARGTGFASRASDPSVQSALSEAGFVARASNAESGNGGLLQGAFDPAWTPRSRPLPADIVPRRCAVIGAGLAGAAAAASLARRGWQVTVLDAADAPAAGASGLPAGLIAAHYSPDDSMLSRLSRCGVRMAIAQARALLRPGSDWELTGVLELRPAGMPCAQDADEALRPWSREAGHDTLASAGHAAGVGVGVGGIWHEHAGWIKPAALVGAWLAQAGVSWRGGSAVSRIAHDGQCWRLTGADGRLLAEAELVVVAAAAQSSALLGGKLATHPVRGQVTWGTSSIDSPRYCVNGDGHFIPSVPAAAGSTWCCGSTFEPDDIDLAPRDADQAFNLMRARKLVPAAAVALDSARVRGALGNWTGVRCASTDRRPLLGETAPGLWVSTAMGSRGLTFAALCGELLAARVHGEPLPLDRRLAQAIDIAR